MSDKSAIKVFLGRYAQPYAKSFLARAGEKN